MALGTAASLLGSLLRGGGNWWYDALGVLMVLMVLQTREIITIIPQSGAVSKNTKKGNLGAALTGLPGGLFAFPCVTPVRVVLPAIVAGSGNILWALCCCSIPWGTAYWCWWRARPSALSVGSPPQKSMAR